MIGAIVGDIVGSRFEFNNHRSKDFELFSLDCFATDDTIMTLSVAKAVMDWKTKGSKPLGDLAVEYMRAIGQKHPGKGYGIRFQEWLFAKNPQPPYNSYGNGAAMRVSACGFAASTEEEAKVLSQKVTEVSHNHPKGLKGAEAVAIAVFMAKNGVGKNDIKKRMKKDYYPLNLTLASIRSTYLFDETCQGSVPQALVAFLESTSFEDAIRNAVSIGGDSDTIGAITGALAEAHYGVPEELRKEALDYLENDLLTIVKEWDEFLLSRS